ncbi:hypothetical protein L7F22_018259 [Adiantum nelumboides]|nr:hypothetical protein [Adiantum nelumboides]
MHCIPSPMCTTLVTAYAKCGTIDEAEHVSSSIPVKDVVSWTAMFSAYGHQGQGTKVLQLYEKMLEEGNGSAMRARYGWMTKRRHILQATGWHLGYRIGLS